MSGARTVLFSLFVLIVALPLQRAAASVLVAGNVVPSDNPFTPQNEGLPDGNDINPFETGPDPLNPVFSADLQTQFEFIGGFDQNGDIIPLPIDPISGEPVLTVGQSSYGAVVINGGSAIRSVSLVIGDEGTSNTGLLTKGTGIVRVTGFNSVYNNNYFLLPFDNPTYAEFGSIRDDIEQSGYDIFVGRFGNGTLELSAGGRAEIQDAVVVGAEPGSTGTVLVDGFDSFLGSGGFDGGVSTPTDPHVMIIGQQGTGFMTISNGGQVYAEAPQGGGGTGDINFAASIGADPYMDSSRPEEGGRGSVTVTGLASKWIVGGSLQIGGFHDSTGGAASEDVEGIFVEYDTDSGIGTLNVDDGGVVNILSSVDETGTNIDLRLAIGRFGRLKLNGGFVNINNTLNVSEPRDEHAQLINDGVISGSGQIETGIFRNRHQGEVRVAAGEKLLITAAGDVPVAPMIDQEPLTNYGRVEVFGTDDSQAEIEFDRSPGIDTRPLLPFLNLRVTRPAGAPPTDFFGGIITGQHSIMRFRSDIINTGMIAFTSGDNYVTGNVFNVDPLPPMPDDEGIIFISGPDTKVVFENDLLSTGTIIIEEGADVDILARHSFVSAGELQIQINPSDFTQISTAGDVGLAGKLSVSLAGFAPGSLSIGDSFEIITAGGDIGGVDLTDPIRPRPDLSVAPSFDELQIPNLASLGLPAGTFLLPIFTPNSVLMSVVFVPGITLAGDFNNDGVVDVADYIVWRKNVGTMNVLPNDPFGGTIGASQYNLWAGNFGAVPGSGAGSGQLGAVPEPTGLALLLSGGVLALVCRRQRRSTR